MKRVPFFDNPITRVQFPLWRGRLVLLMIGLGFVVLLGRAVYLQGINRDFLQEQGGKRYERTLTLQASRGKIFDRNGVVIAASIPARGVWANPELAKAASPDQIKTLASLLEMPVSGLSERLSDGDKTFVYLRRQVPTERAQEIAALKVPGVHDLYETRRFYPEGESMGHVVGFTDLDGRGQEGVELAYEDVLSGKPGSRRVLRDRLGRIVEDVRDVHLPTDGRDLHLSIDTRIQYQVHRALAQAVKDNKAQSASAVVIDVKTGEILAMVNYPMFNPNDRATLSGASLRNRILTDTFEPGSIFKPFTVALALELGRITPQSRFNTENGEYLYHGARIRDVSRNSVLDTMGVLTKSSNIGMIKISESLKAQEMWSQFTELGFGQPPATGLPGAVAGRLRPWERWRPIEKATMAYGYGLSVSLLQIARAYTAFARDGDMVNLTLIKRTNTVATVPVFPPEIARQVRSMLEASAGPDGARLANVQGYRIAGKSGTARKIVNGAYSQSLYRSSFVGFAPVSNPRVVVAVTVDEPTAGHYYGGRVAAPVFSEITGRTLRLLGLKPDAPFASEVVALAGGGTQ